MANSGHHHRNNVATLVLNHHPHPRHHHRNHHFRLWTSFSADSFRRKLIATLICGGGACSTSSPKPTKKPEPNTSTRSRVGPEKLADLLNVSDSCSSSMSIERREKEEEEEEAEEVKRKEQRMKELREAVRKLQSDLMEERENGSKLIRGMAREDAEARSILTMMGAIPPLVAMIGVRDGETESQIEALYALLNLGIGNDLNKAAIVQAGAVQNMVKKIESSNGSLESDLSEAIVANFLALSALDSNKPIIGASGAIRFLVSILKDSDKKCSPQARQDTLRALYNLSILPSNIALFLETEFIPYLIMTLGDMEVSERILAIISNIVSTSEGRRAISGVPDVFPVLIDVLNWSDSTGCQEKASYVLMVMAHRSYTDRQRMIEAGIGSALLELTLLGSTLAQKRASRILECLRVKQSSQRLNVNASAAVSAPICGSSSSTTNIDLEEDMISEEKKAVKQLVQQSLQNNLKRIIKRANLPQDFVPSEHLKSLTMGSTSKSLPF